MKEKLYVLCHSDKNYQNVILGVYKFKDSDEKEAKELELAEESYNGDVKLYNSCLETSKKQLEVYKEAKEFIANNGYISSRNDESLYKRCERNKLYFETKEMYYEHEERIIRIVTSKKSIKCDIKKLKKEIKDLKEIGMYTFQGAGYFWEETYFRE